MTLLRYSFWQFVALSLFPTYANSASLDDVCTDFDSTNGECTIFIKSNGPFWGSTWKQFFGSDQYFDKSIAVIVGIGSYTSGYNHLEAAPQEAQRVRDFLVNTAGYDVVILLKNSAASEERLGLIMEDIIPAELTESDRFLFYWAGHGETRNLFQERKRGYLVTSTAEKGLWSNKIGMDRIEDWSENVAIAHQSLWVLDSCFSGLAGLQTQGSLAELTRTNRLAQRGHHLLTAGLEGEESLIVGNRSLFTKSFLDALENADLPIAGEPPDGLISLNEVNLWIGNSIDNEIARLQRRYGNRFKMSPQSSTLHDDDGQYFFMVSDRSNIPHFEPDSSSQLALSNPEELVQTMGVADQETNSRADVSSTSTNVALSGVMSIFLAAQESNSLTLQNCMGNVSWKRNMIDVIGTCLRNGDASDPNTFTIAYASEPDATLEFSFEGVRDRWVVAETNGGIKINYDFHKKLFSMQFINQHQLSNYYIRNSSLLSLSVPSRKLEFVNSNNLELPENNLPESIQKQPLSQRFSMIESSVLNLEWRIDEECGTALVSLDSDPNSLAINLKRDRINISIEPSYIEMRPDSITSSKFFSGNWVYTFENFMTGQTAETRTKAVDDSENVPSREVQEVLQILEDYRLECNDTQTF